MSGRPLLDYYEGPPPSKKRSRTMAKIRGKDTSPEMNLRRALWADGGRYRCHVKDLPGRPDLANKRAQLAVFVDGCFWHGCPDHFRLPKTRPGFWKEKIRRNKERRKKVRREYSDGWQVLEFYECELNANLEAVRNQIRTLLG